MTSDHRLDDLILTILAHFVKDKSGAKGGRYNNFGNIKYCNEIFVYRRRKATKKLTNSETCVCEVGAQVFDSMKDLRGLPESAS